MLTTLRSVVTCGQEPDTVLDKGWCRNRSKAETRCREHPKNESADQQRSVECHIEVGCGHDADPVAWRFSLRASLNLGQCMSNTPGKIGM